MCSEMSQYMPSRATFSATARERGGQRGPAGQAGRALGHGGDPPEDLHAAGAVSHREAEQERWRPRAAPAVAIATCVRLGAARGLGGREGKD